MPRRFRDGYRREMACGLALGVMAIEDANKSALCWRWLCTPIVWNTNSALSEIQQDEAKKDDQG
ncbi:MAG: hypothetical protein ACYC3O_05390 [Burkholderiales bacterium]